MQRSKATKVKTTDSIVKPTMFNTKINKSVKKTERGREKERKHSETQTSTTKR